jgi:hypothetical protein
MLKSQLVAGGDATIYRVTHFRFFVFEAIWQRDPRPMFLAGCWALDWLDR